MTDPATTPPPELRLYWQCLRFNALPEPGALFDQDAGLLARMGMLGNVYDAIGRIKSLTGKDIARMRPEDGRIWVWLERNGFRV